MPWSRSTSDFRPVTRTSSRGFRCSAPTAVLDSTSCAKGVAQRIATRRDEKLAAHFEQADPQARRYLARLLRGIHRAPTPIIWHAVLRQEGAPTASILLGHWLESEAPITLAEIARRSRVPSVRAAAVWRLGQSARPDHLEMVESALFDASGGVRRTAQTAVRDQGVDPASNFES